MQVLVEVADVGLEVEGVLLCDVAGSLFISLLLFKRAFSRCGFSGIYALSLVSYQILDSSRRDFQIVFIHIQAQQVLA
jgi:hypothetical protein